MTLKEAVAIALLGGRFRRSASTSWFSRGVGLWYIQPLDEERRVVRSGDFTATNFFATDYTTDPITDIDICSLPGATRPQFDAPAVSVQASYLSGTLTIKGTIGAGSYGAYRLAMIVNGVTLWHGIAAEPGDFEQAFAIDWTPRYAIVFRAESVLPLLPFRYDAPTTVLVAPTVCLTMPIADYVVEITGAQFAQYVNGGTWDVSVTENFSEAYPGSTASGTGSGSEAAAYSGCSGSVDTVSSSSIHYNEGGSEYDNTFDNDYDLDISVGFSGGRYYLGISLSGFFTTTGPGTGWGSGTMIVDGHSVPIFSEWSPAWSGFSGYTNSSTFSIVANFTP